MSRVIESNTNIVALSRQQYFCSLQLHWKRIMSTVQLAMGDNWIIIKHGSRYDIYVSLFSPYAILTLLLGFHLFKKVHTSKCINSLQVAKCIYSRMVKSAIPDAQMLSYNLGMASYIVNAWNWSGIDFEQYLFSTPIEDNIMVKKTFIAVLYKRHIASTVTRHRDRQRLRRSKNVKSVRFLWRSLRTTKAVWSLPVDSWLFPDCNKE